MRIQNNNNNIYFGIRYKKIPKDKLEKLIMQGNTYSQIGEMYDIPARCVSRFVKSYQLKSPSQLLKEKKVAAIIYWYKQGISVDAIKANINASREFVRHIIEDYKKSLGPKRMIPLQRESFKDKTIVALMRKLNIKEIDVQDSLL